MNLIDANLKRNLFLHGIKSEVDLASVSVQGFRPDIIDEEGRWMREGNLGIGTYLSCDWKMAFWFGRVLVEATTQKGTRILDVRPEADRRKLDSLSREFGAEILNSRDIKKVIPHNKQLTLPELVALTRHYYHKTWDKNWGKDSEGFDRWPNKRTRYSDGLRSLVSLLKRYKFHGYGDPQSDNGILIFASDRVKLLRVIAEVDPIRHSELIEGNRLEGMNPEMLAKLPRGRLGRA